MTLCLASLLHYPLTSLPARRKEDGTCSCLDILVRMVDDDDDGLLFCFSVFLLTQSPTVVLVTSRRARESKRAHLDWFSRVEKRLFIFRYDEMGQVGRFVGPPQMESERLAHMNSCP